VSENQKVELPKPFKRIILEWPPKDSTKETLQKIIETYYGVNLLSLRVDRNGIQAEIVELGGDRIE